eukprot:gene5734-6301_t
MARGGTPPRRVPSSAGGRAAPRTPPRTPPARRLASQSQSPSGGGTAAARSLRSPPRGAAACDAAEGGARSVTDEEVTDLLRRDFVPAMIRAAAPTRPRASDTHCCMPYSL